MRLIFGVFIYSIDGTIASKAKLALLAIVPYRRAPISTLMVRSANSKFSTQAAIKWERLHIRTQKLETRGDGASVANGAVKCQEPGSDLPPGRSFAPALTVWLLKRILQYTTVDWTSLPPDRGRELVLFTSGSMLRGSKEV